MRPCFVRRRRTGKRVIGVLCPAELPGAPSALPGPGAGGLPRPASAHLSLPSLQNMASGRCALAADATTCAREGPWRGSNTPCACPSADALPYAASARAARICPSCLPPWGRHRPTAVGEPAQRGHRARLGEHGSMRAAPRQWARGRRAGAGRGGGGQRACMAAQISGRNASRIVLYMPSSPSRLASLRGGPQLSDRFAQTQATCPAASRGWPPCAG